MLGFLAGVITGVFSTLAVIEWRRSGRDSQGG